MADNLQEKQLRGSDFEQILAALNLRLAGSFNLFSCLLKRGAKSLKKEVVVLNSSRKSLQRVDPKGGQKSVSLN